ncbi:DUF808 family protein [Aliarcobacter lanthieri]|uniref:DUF808 family protein n=1 Tax=Aliarcobacter lanthieri TaxID=1355374 RepID=UPI003AA8AF6E
MLFYKVKSAVKTDFILSFEIIVISLSLLDNSDFITKLFVLISVGILTTVFVYGIVAFIIKLDDIILGAIVGYITILTIQSSFKLFKIK